MTTAKLEVSAELLAEMKEYLSYNPETGVFTWIKHRRNIKTYADAASNNGQYIKFGFKGNRYYAHRIAWLFTYGKMPTDLIDHINGIKTDNRIANLREATDARNSENKRTPKSNNKSGYLGVAFQAKRWRCQIKANGKRIHLGYFDTPEQAHQAYLEAKRNLHEFCTI